MWESRTLPRLMIDSPSEKMGFFVSEEEDTTKDLLGKMSVVSRGGSLGWGRIAALGDSVMGSVKVENHSLFVDDRFQMDGPVP